MKLLADENSGWFKHYKSIFDSQGITLLCVGDPGLPESGTSDEEIMEYCIKQSISLITENKCDFKRIFFNFSDSDRTRYIEKGCRIYYTRQKWVPSGAFILNLILHVRSNMHEYDRVGISLGNISQKLKIPNPTA